MLRLQRLAGNAAVTSRLLPLQRISYDRCEVREGDVRIAHNRAKNLVNNTIRKLRAYDGSQADVRGALSQHFHGTSQIVAFAVANHLTSVMLFVDWAQYECHEDETNGSALASTIWCVPFTDISLWKPWFTLALDDQPRHHLGQPAAVRPRLRLRGDLPPIRHHPSPAQR